MHTALLTTSFAFYTAHIATSGPVGGNGRWSDADYQKLKNNMANFQAVCKTLASHGLLFASNIDLRFICTLQHVFIFQQA